VRNCLLDDEALPDKISDVSSGAVRITSIGKLLEVLDGNGAEFAELAKGVNF
jgi:hypothetical protein